MIPATSGAAATPAAAPTTSSKPREQHRADRDAVAGERPIRRRARYPGSVNGSDVDPNTTLTYTVTAGAGEWVGDR